MSIKRKLKVYSKCRIRRWDNIIVPEIRLEGNWLAEIGFKAGEHVNIQVQQNQIMITLNNEKRLQLKK